MKHYIPLIIAACMVSTTCLPAFAESKGRTTAPPPSEYEGTVNWFAVAAGLAALVVVGAVVSSGSSSDDTSDLERGKREQEARNREMESAPNDAAAAFAFVD